MDRRLSIESGTAEYLNGVTYPAEVADVIAGAGIRGTNWSDREIDLIIADHFAMLETKIAGQPFVERHRTRRCGK